MEKLAILLATYNGEKYLSEMLASLEAQTWQNFVCYIHDDGSTDATVAILNEWVEAHPNGQYRLLEGPPSGSAKANFMWMLNAVEAEAYMLADCDDVWLPNKVEISLNTLNEHSSMQESLQSPCCAFSDMYVVDSELNILDASFISYIGRDPQALHLGRLLVDNPAAGCTMIFNKALRDLAIQLKHPAKIEMHDHWLMALAAAFGSNHITHINQPLVYYRQHGGNVMGAVAESNVQKLWRNIAAMFNGTNAAKKRAFIQEARDLAAEMCLVEPLPPQARQFLENLADIENKGKFARIKFYRNHKIDRAKGTFWMYLWI